MSASADGFLIENTLFEDNQVDNMAGSNPGTGGAIAVEQPWGMAALPAPGPMVIRNCTFRNNRAYRGGAVSSMISHGRMTIDACTFDSNTAYTVSTLGSGLGGALALRTRAMDRPFRGAASDSGASPHFAAHAAYDITSCVFTNNAATTRPRVGVGGTTGGGAIALWHGGYSVSIVNCSFEGNVAARGGALWYSGDSTVATPFLDAHGFVGPGGAPLATVDYWYRSKDTSTSDSLDYFVPKPTDVDDYLSLAPLAELSGYRVVVVGSTFVANVAAPSAHSGRALGGAVYVDCGELAVSASRLANNAARASAALDLGSSGGALFVTNDCATADFSTYETANVTLVDTYFDGNTAATRGGAVSLENAVGAAPGERTMLLSARGCAFNNSAPPPSPAASQLLGGA